MRRNPRTPSGMDAPAPPRWSVDRRAAALTAVLWLAALVAVGEFVAGHAYALYDDAYIYFRYAANFLAGHGFRWNPADAPVEGFTGPLYLWMLIAGGAAGIGLEDLSQLFGTAAVTAAIALAAMAAARLVRASEGASGPALAAGAAVFFALAFDHSFLVNAVTGLETGLAAALASALLLSALHDGRGLRTLLVLAVLTRPEFAVFSAAALVLPKARSVRWYLPLVVAAVVIAGWRWSVFHDVLPNTFYAKSGGTAAHFALGVEYIVGAVREFPLIVGAPLALIPRKTRAIAGWFLVATAVWFAHFLRTGGDFFHLSRLAAPLVPALTALTLAGCVRLAERPGRRPVALGVAAAIAAAAFAYARPHRLAPLHSLPDVDYWSDLGRYLGEEHPDARFATTTIGAMGYFSGAHVYDLVGLTQPEVAKDGELLPPELIRRNYIGHERHNTAWIIEQRPDLVVFERDSDTPWTDVQTARASYYSEWAFLEEVRLGRLDYRLFSPEIRPGVYALIFASPEYIARYREARGITPVPTPR